MVTAWTCTLTGSVNGPLEAKGEPILSGTLYEPGVMFAGLTDTVTVAGVVPPTGVTVSQGGFPGTPMEKGSGRLELLRAKVWATGCVEFPVKANDKPPLGSGSNGARTVSETGTTV